MEIKCECCGENFVQIKQETVCSFCMQSINEALKQDMQRYEWHQEMRLDAFGPVHG